MDEVSQNAKILALASVAKGVTELLSSNDRKRLTSCIELDVVDYEYKVKNSYDGSFENQIYNSTLDELESLIYYINFS